VQKRFRLTRSDDFKRVRQTGKSYAHPLVVLVMQANEAKKHLKIGISAGKTIGTAIQRNRAKRLLREAVRPLIPSIASGFDLILIARSGLPTSTLADTRSALNNILNRAKLLRSIPTDES
jgi:ribonuclease P protein component